LLVALGAGMRDIQPRYWLRELAIQMERQRIKPESDIVITDVRYSNEISWIHDRGGIVVRIHRPGYEPANSEEARSFHQISVDYPRLPNVTNDGTPEQLAKKVLALAHKHTPVEVTTDKLGKWLIELGEFTEIKPMEASIRWGITLREAKERLHSMMGDLLVIPLGRVEVYVHGEGFNIYQPLKSVDSRQTRRDRLRAIDTEGLTVAQISELWEMGTYETNKYLRVLYKDNLICDKGNARYRLWARTKQGQKWLDQH